MDKLIKGRVWKFGDNIDTDVISPTKFIDLPMEELKAHALEEINPKFPKEVGSGDLVVAGKNFGCGSSREQAATVLKALGVGAVVAESFARIFLRNAIAHGLPILVCPDVSQNLEEGEELEVNIEKAIVKKINQGTVFEGMPLSKDMLDILRKGGILPLLKEIGSQKHDSGGGVDS
ncbi:MAG: 3-isopropylmalate dehydratase [Desulfobacteraceae bacterium]